MDNIDLIFATKFKVAANAIKKICNSAQISCYTLIDDSEIDYIFKDLRPKIFLCATEYRDDFKQDFIGHLKLNDTIKIICSDEDDPDFDINWPREIDSFNFTDNIKNLLGR